MGASQSAEHFVDAVDVVDQRLHLLGLENRLADGGRLVLPRLEERVAAGLPIVLFAKKAEGGDYVVFAYTNGTWFHLSGQQTGGADEIGEFCQLNYGVSFPMFEKIDVNGDAAHPLYEWLRSEKSGVLGDKIKWNFTKFLIGKDGTVIKRYGSTTKPEKIAGDIEKALAA